MKEKKKEHNWQKHKRHKRFRVAVIIKEDTTIAIARFNLRRAQCLGIHDIFRFWIPCCGFQIPGSWFWNQCPWNLDSGFQLLVGSRFLELYSRFQGPGFQIPQAKNNSPDSRIPIPLQGVIRRLRLERGRCLTNQIKCWYSEPLNVWIEKGDWLVIFNIYYYFL